MDECALQWGLDQAQCLVPLRCRDERGNRNTKYCILVFVSSSHQASVQEPSRGQWPLQAVIHSLTFRKHLTVLNLPLWGFGFFSHLEIIIIFSISIRIFASLFL